MFLFLSGLLAMLLWGCQRCPDDTPPATALNQGYALLYDLVSQQQDLNKILWIKNTSPPVVELIEAIADVSGEMTRHLDEWQQADPTIRLDSTGLPEVDQATRKAITSYKTMTLLGDWGETFTRDLLLTQNEALNYGGYLMKVLSEKTPEADHAETLRTTGKRYLDLRDQAMAHLTVTTSKADADSGATDSSEESSSSTLPLGPKR